MTDAVQSVPLIDAQLAAYNARDLEAFLGCFAEHAVVRGADGVEMARGRTALAAAYGALFDAQPELHAEILGRLVEGDVVVDQEVVTIARGMLRAIVAYEVVEGRIVSMTTLAQSAE